MEQRRNEPIDITRHPRLGGLLLSANQRIEDAGGGLFLAGLLSLILCYFLLANEVELGGFDLAEYNSWHSYVFLLVLHFIVFSVLSDLYGKRAWLSARHEVFEELRMQGLDQYELIASLEDSARKTYEQVLTHLKKEKAG